MSTVGPTEPVLTAKAFLFPSCNIIKNKFRSRIDVLCVRALLVLGRVLAMRAALPNNYKLRKGKKGRKETKLTEFGCFCLLVGSKSLEWPWEKLMQIKYF